MRRRPSRPGVNCAPQLAAVSSDALRYIDPWTQDTDHWSVYGLVEWEFIDSWKLILRGPLFGRRGQGNRA